MGLAEYDIYLHETLQDWTKIAESKLVSIQVSTRDRAIDTDGITKLDNICVSLLYFIYDISRLKIKF